jgi:hypothetical protein
MSHRPLIHPTVPDSFNDCFPPFLFGVVNGQAHVSSPEQAPYQDPWVSYAHGNQVGT